METRMGIEDSLKHSLGPCVSASGSLAVSMYPAGEKGVTFMPSVSEEGIISWENDGGMINPEPVDIHGMNITNIEQTVVSSENDGINIVTVELKDGSKSEIQIKNGSQGDPATIKVGETTTGGEEIKVTNSGTEKNVILDFSFPPVATTVNLNGEINSGPILYAPINSGEEGNVLVSKGQKVAPEWVSYNDVSSYNLIRYSAPGTLNELVLRPGFRAALLEFKNQFINNLNKKPFFELGCLQNKNIDEATSSATYNINEYEDIEDAVGNGDFYSSVILNHTTYNKDKGIFTLKGIFSNSFFFGKYYSSSVITIKFYIIEDIIEKIEINISDFLEGDMKLQGLSTSYIRLVDWWSENPEENLEYIQPNEMSIKEIFTDRINITEEITLKGNSLNFNNGEVLFNSTGELGNITLSDDVSNYTTLEIYYQDSNAVGGMIKTEVWDGSWDVSLSTIDSHGVFCYFKAKTVTVEGNTIKNSGKNYSEVEFSANNIKVNNNNAISITKVIGYKG